MHVEALGTKARVTGASPGQTSTRYTSVQRRWSSKWVVRALWLVVVSLVVVVLIGGVSAHSGNNPPGKRQHCTHGVSSVGPVVVRNGKVVGGSTVPDTQACLP